MSYTFIDIFRIYEGSNGDATKALYAEFEKLGPAGAIAVNIFRATKSSARAKVYRGGGYRGMAYERKQWSIDNLAKALSEHAATLGIVWGWGEDKATVGFEHVLYVDLPTGAQVSFHSPVRGAGPEYAGKWDGVRGEGPNRACRYAFCVLSGEALAGGAASAPAETVMHQQEMLK